MTSKTSSKEFNVFNNLDVFFDEFKDYDCVHIYNYSINRFFCKCGHVSNKAESSCPICGNDKVKKLYSYGGRSIVQQLSYLNTIDGKTIELKHKVCSIEENISLKEFNFVIDSDKVFGTIKDNKLITNKVTIDSILNFNSSELINSIEYDDFKKIYKDIDTDFEDKYDLTSTFNNLFDYKSMYMSYKYKCNRFSYYLIYIILKEHFPKLYSGKHYYPYILANILMESMISTLPKTFTLEDMIDDYSLNDFKSYLNNDWFLNHLCDLSCYNKLKNEYKEILIYAVGHYRISFKELSNIIKKMCDFTELLEGYAEDCFIDFLRSNFIIYRENIISEYEERIQFLNKNKIKITKNNLKNIKSLKSLKSLEDMGYPKENLDLIADMFFDNPIKAMSYLKSKKKFTKKEITEISESFIK